MSLQGGVITRRPLCWDPDGKVFFAPCGKDVRVYSAISGEHVNTLRGHTAAATAVALDPTSSSQVYTSSRDGSLRLWDFFTGECLRTYPVGQPLEHMVFSAAANMAYLSLAHRLGAGKVLALQLPSGAPLSSSVRPRGAPRQMAVSPSGRFLAAPDRFSLWVWAAGEDGGRRPANFHHVRQYTCCAFDASDSILAAGDISGRIVIWHGFQRALAAGGCTSNGSTGAGGAVPACQTLHWHAHAVGCLAFSPDGTHLMSGGSEAVLVQWHLASGKRNYLPRLGGPLVGIRPCPSDPAKYLVAQADNTVRVVNVAAMQVEATVHGLRPAPPPPPGRAPGGCALLQPGSGYLVVSGPNALLQFFDATRERHVMRLQVAARNPVSLTRDAAAHVAAGAPPPVEPQVVAAAFSAAGGALVTVDVAPSTGATSAGTQQSLKFWDAAPAAAQAGAAAPYALNTRADAPHQGPVTGLAWHPLDDVIASCSEDGEFRIWCRAPPPAQRQQQQQQQPARWRCRSVGGYKRRPLGTCAFSRDGSLLAVGAGATATLWEPRANALVAVLPAPCGGQWDGGEEAGAAAEAAAAGEVEAAAEAGRQWPGGAGRRRRARLVHLAFSSGSPHLAGVVSCGPGHSSGDDVLVIWDLLTLSVAWSCSVPSCSSLVADPSQALFSLGVNFASGGLEQQQQEPRHPSQHHEEQSQQQQQHSRAHRRAQRRACVLVFSPSSPVPVYSCALPPGAPVASLLPLPPRLQAGAADGGATPLLAVTEDRHYTVVAHPGGSGTALAAGAPAADASKAAPAAAGGPDESALEAVFGKPPGGEGQRPAGAGAGAPDARAASKRVAALFDAPSHALPPPSLLCPSLLELLLAGGDD